MSEFKRDQIKPDDGLMESLKRCESLFAGLMASLKRSESLFRAGFNEGLKAGRRAAYNEIMALLNEKPTKRQAG